MLQEEWWEEYKRKNLIINQDDNPSIVILILNIIVICSGIIYFIQQKLSLTLGMIYNRIIAYIIIIAILFKVGEIKWQFDIEKKIKKNFKIDETIFINILNKYKIYTHSNNIENFLNLVMINNKVEKKETFTSIIFPIICSYLFAIPSILEDQNNIDKSNLYPVLIIIVIFILSCKYILDIVFDILVKNNKNKKDEYKLAIVAKNHLYNIEKKTFENSWCHTIKQIIKKIL